MLITVAYGWLIQTGWVKRARYPMDSAHGQCWRHWTPPRHDDVIRGGVDVYSHPSEHLVRAACVVSDQSVSDIAA